MCGLCPVRTLNQSHWVLFKHKSPSWCGWCLWQRLLFFVKVLKQVATVAKCKDNMLKVRFIDVQVEPTSVVCLQSPLPRTALCGVVHPFTRSGIYVRVKCFEKGKMLNFPPSFQLRIFVRRRGESTCLLPLLLAGVIRPIEVWHNVEGVESGTTKTMWLSLPTFV